MSNTDILAEIRANREAIDTLIGKLGPVLRAIANKEPADAERFSSAPYPVSRDIRKAGGELSGDDLLKINHKIKAHRTASDKKQRIPETSNRKPDPILFWDGECKSRFAQLGLDFEGLRKAAAECEFSSGKEAHRLREIGRKLTAKLDISFEEPDELRAVRSARPQPLDGFFMELYEELLTEKRLLNDRLRKEAQAASRTLAEKSLPKAQWLAYQSFKYAEAREERRLEDKIAYDFLKENGFDCKAGDIGKLESYRLPDFDTWSRYLRSARKHLKEGKYIPRSGREPPR